MLFKLFGIEKKDRFVQPLKADSPITAVSSGMVMEVSIEQFSNAAKKMGPPVMVTSRNVAGM